MFQKFKQWLSNSLPTFAADKAKHFLISWIIANIIMLGGVLFNPINGLLAMVGLIALIIAWELPDLIKNKFNKEAEQEAQQDVLFGFAGLFFQMFVLAILSTR